MTCWCCAGIRENGQPRPPREALYEWQTPTGYWFPLCANCCALWRLNAAEDDSLTPLEVRTLA